MQINPFIKYKGLDIFGIYKIASGSNEISVPIADKVGAFTQIAAEMVFRFDAE